MNRILLEPHELEADGTARLSDTRARHIRSVLRAGPGATVRVGLVDGPAGTATVQRLADTEVVLACVFETAPCEAEPLDLVLALPRPKVLRRLLPQIAALGVRHLFLTNSWRVEKNYFATHVLAADFLRACLVEGIQQAGTTRLPRVSLHRHLRKLLEEDLDRSVPAHAGRLLAHPGAAVPLGLRKPREGEVGVVLAVGPEGGWIEPERALFGAHGFQAVSLGARILRSDTACVALLGVLVSKIDSLRPGRATSEKDT